MTPVRCVVDTNVAITASGRNDAASAKCAAASAKALQRVMSRGHVFIDAAGAIVAEYRKSIDLSGQPHPGSAYLKWLLNHQHGETHVTRVVLTPKADNQEDFKELPPAPPGVHYDLSDRKFLAVAAAHPEHPAILQSMDSKWWGWQGALADIKVSIHFLCPKEIEQKYKDKMGP